MKKQYAIAALAAMFLVACNNEKSPEAVQEIFICKPGVDTIYVSSMYTTHIHFPTDLVYADLSNKTDLDAMVVEKSKDVIAVKAKYPFGNTCNITAIESNGKLKSYIIKYREHADVLIIDEKYSWVTDRPDTVEISSLYTSHLVFSSALLYADLSDMEGVSAMILPQSQNVLALKARMDFGARTSSVSVLESDGFLHTYILRYVEHPAKKVIRKWHFDECYQAISPEDDNLATCLDTSDQEEGEPVYYEQRKAEGEPVYEQRKVKKLPDAS